MVVEQRVEARYLQRLTAVGANSGSGLPALPLEMNGERIVAALNSAGGNRQAAAQTLGISRTTLWRRLREMAADVGAEV